MSPKITLRPPRLTPKAALSIRVEHAQDCLEKALAALEGNPTDRLLIAVVIGRWADLRAIKALVPGEGTTCSARGCTWRARIVRSGSGYCVRHDPEAHRARALCAVERQRRKYAEARP